MSATAPTEIATVSTQRKSEDDPLYDAFRRNDRYGRVGREPQPFAENLRLALLAVTIVPIKAVGTFLTVFSFWLVCRLSFLVPSRWRAFAVAELGKLHCRLCLFWFGFLRIRHVQVDVGKQQQQLEDEGRELRPAGIVCNHAGWADILVVMSLYFPAFVARESTKNIPLIGIISRIMGCLYVDRALTNGSQGVSALVKRRMEDVAAGVNPHVRPLLLFPEGTTTNNRYMLPFRTGAFLAGTPLRPVMLVYDRDDPVSLSWESIPIQRHMFLVLANPTHSVTVYEFPVYYPTQAEKDDPRLYASNVRAYMRRHGPPAIPSDPNDGFIDSVATFADKQDYLALLHVAQDVPRKAEQDVVLKAAGRPSSSTRNGTASAAAVAAVKKAS